MEDFLALREASYGDGSPNKRQKRSHRRNEPAFMDATATVSADTFGARRLPELRNLYFAAVMQNGDDNNNGNDATKFDDHFVHERKNLLSGGGKRSSRHLRRRTTAVDSKKHRHRYPVPYRAVRGNNSDIESHDQGEGNFSKTESCKGSQPIYKGVTRKSKRKKKSFLENQRLRWLLSENNTDTAGASVDDESAKEKATTTNNNEEAYKPVPKSWLVTHLWHAKRFHLLAPKDTGNDGVRSRSPFGEWTGIPLVHTNRGARAALRLSQNKDRDDGISAVMVRDVTWEAQPLVIEYQRVADSGVPTQAHGLLHQLGRICPELAVLLQPACRERLESFVAGSLSLEATAHAPDAFPSGALGPACWRMLPENGRSAAITAVEVRCHPSVLPRIEKSIQQLIESDTLGALRMGNTKNVPRICFRLYGEESGTVLNRLLQLSEDEDDLFSLIQDLTGSFSGMLPNGGTVDIDNVSVTGATTATPEKATDRVTLIYRAPRPMDCPANLAMAGWEVHASNPAFARDLWLAMVTLDSSPRSGHSGPRVRGCCAIGLVEECHMRLECEPPLPIYPRDFPDTIDSRLYWNRSSEQPSDDSWKRIRQLCEGGWGRLPVDKEKRLDKLEAVDFGGLVSSASEVESDAENDTSQSETDAKAKEKVVSSIVAVRGDFGQPFVDAIKGCCASYSPKESTQSIATKKRRNRRSSRPKNQTLRAPPLSKNSRTSLREYCLQLSSSLSLPAVLLVHVRAIGSGRILPGMAILAAPTPDESHSNRMLGRITSGSFSTSRGVCHGIGVVGSTRLLDYLGQTTNESEARAKQQQGLPSSYGCVVKLTNGAQSLQLLVHIARPQKPGEGGNSKIDEESTGCEASLTALT